jgi:hypothetical protein
VGAVGPGFVGAVGPGFVGAVDPGFVGPVDPGFVGPVGPAPVGAVRRFLTHFCFFLTIFQTYPILHFFFAATALGEPLPPGAAIAEPAGSADAPAANTSVASTPNRDFRAIRIVVLPFFSR